jgi:hypothetical protein
MARPSGNQAIRQSDHGVPEAHAEGMRGRVTCLGSLRHRLPEAIKQGTRGRSPRAGSLRGVPSETLSYLRAEQRDSDAQPSAVGNAVLARPGSKGGAR